MPCAPLLRFSDTPAEKRVEAGEVMSGILEVVGGSNFTSTGSPIRSVPNHRRPVTNPQAQRVFVRVYRTSSEHFAVLYPVKAIVTACRPLASINLKSCTVKSLPGTEFRVSPRSCEGTTVIFKGTESTSDVQIAEWLQAFTEQQDTLRRKKVSDHRLPLPVLIESEEEDEKE